MGTALLTHFRKSQSYALILNPNNSQTTDQIRKVKTAFSTRRTKYITNKVLMNLTKCFRFYSYFKCVHKVCVNGLVKRYQVLIFACFACISPAGGVCLVYFGQIIEDMSFRDCCINKIKKSLMIRLISLN